MVHFRCTRCKQPITGPVAELEDLSLIRDGDREDYVPRGTFLPVGRLADENGEVELGIGGVDEVIFNLDDLQNTKHGGVLNGCCGIDGCDGINTFCHNGHKIGTERSDCWTSRCIHVPMTNIESVSDPMRFADGSSFDRMRSQRTLRCQWRKRLQTVVH